MRTFRFTLLLSVMLATIPWLSGTAFGQPGDELRWVPVGKSDVLWNFTYMFTLGLEVPYGETSINDIKQGLVPLRFTLKWLPPKTPREKVARYFQSRLQKHFASAEAFQRNFPAIRKLLEALPAAQKHDLWHIVYDPDAGTLFFVDEQKIHHAVGAHLNRALLKNWLNDNPVTTAQLLNRLIQRQNAR